jgi:hypothetical protein
VPRARALAQAGLLWLCEGTQRGATLANAHEFATEARLPRLPWRALHLWEIETLCAAGTGAATVEIFDPLPADRALHELQSPDAMRSYAERYVGSLTNAEGHRLRLNAAPRLRFNEPRLITTTRDPSDGGRLLGLHVDSQDGRAVRERQFCRRFLCINSGAEPRSLLFVNQPLDTLATAIADLPELAEPASRNATDFARAWLAMHTEYPVLRVDIVPGGAYLAPVQNMIHDGSTLLTRTRDWHAGAFGEFER